MWSGFMNGSEIMAINDTITVTITSPLGHVTDDRSFGTCFIVETIFEVMRTALIARLATVSPVGPGYLEWPAKVGTRAGVMALFI